MLKNRLTPEEWNALPETDKAHYSKSNDSKGEGYFLQTEENTGLKRSLATERSEKEKAVKLLKQVVPELSDENRAEWEDLVSAAADRALELKDVDPDEWKQYQADKGEDGKDRQGGKSKADELSEQLLESQKQVRELQREKQSLERDKAKQDAKALKLSAENDRLVQVAALNKALDAAKIIDPADRRVVTALFKEEGILLREVGSGEEARREAFVKVEGVEVPIEEYAKDFAATDLGKRYVKAPDNSGTSAGPTPAPTTREDRSKITDPIANLGAVLESNAATRSAARAQ